MAISKTRIKTATNEYNELMLFLGLQVMTTEWNPTWNIADMVEECRHQLEMYGWEEHICYITLHQLDGVKLTLADLLDKKAMDKHYRAMKEVQWAKDGMAKLNGFIKKYGKLAGSMECAEH